MKPQRSTLTTLVACGATALATAAICAGSAAALPKNDYGAYPKLGIFSVVLGYVQKNYVEDVDDNKLLYGAIRGMLETLDPHSSFLDPQQYQQMKAETRNQFGGIGIEVEVREGLLTIMTVIDGTPAARAGLASGDVINKIDGKPTQGITLDEALTRMRGDKGTPVQLAVGRKSWPEPRSIALVRDIIKYENVSSRLMEPGIGYLKIRQFSDATSRDVEEQLDALEKPPGGKLKGLVLDLRNNPGGLFEQAVRVADEFVDQGPLVRTEGRHGQVLDEEVATLRGTRLGFPIICLVNGGSASASEIVAGALQDHGRAVIMGTQTFGKGSVQSVIPLDDGSALKLTIARYYTPSGRSIQEHGITPDVVVEKLTADSLRPDTSDEPDKKERDLPQHLRNTQDQEKKLAALPQHPHSDADNKDFQLHTAVDYLKAWSILTSGNRMKLSTDKVAGR